MLLAAQRPQNVYIGPTPGWVPPLEASASSVIFLPLCLSRFLPFWKSLTLFALPGSSSMSLLSSAILLLTLSLALTSFPTFLRVRRFWGLALMAHCLLL